MILAVCGLHLTGGALNHQLTSAGATLAETTTSCERYTLHALRSGGVAKPGMVYHPGGGEGCGAVELELWEVPSGAVGAFLDGIPAPLGLGRVVLGDDRVVAGFVCEGWAAVPALAAVEGVESVDITRFGGWRAYVKAQESDTAIK